MQLSLASGTMGAAQFKRPCSGDSRSLTGRPVPRRRPEGKVGELQVRPYEVMAIFDASLEEDAVKAQVQRYTGQLVAAGATSLKVDFWGKRRFAYPLHHRNEGYYVVIAATSEPGAIFELDRQLKLADEILRHKVMRLPERPSAQARPPASSSSSDNTKLASTTANGA
jgi:small subunit ribosomal protein S6